jgi:NADH:ubiquinone oxidoreductase subunit 2 (subunit N)
MEAGIKYVLFGAAASGIALFGISYIFGITHKSSTSSDMTNQTFVIGDSVFGFIFPPFLFCCKRELCHKVFKWFNNKFTIFI